MHICESCGHAIDGTQAILYCATCGGEICDRENCRVERDGDIYCTTCAKESDELVVALCSSVIRVAA